MKFVLTACVVFVIALLIGIPQSLAIICGFSVATLAAIRSRS